MKLQLEHEERMELRRMEHEERMELRRMEHEKEMKEHEERKG